MQGRRQPGYDLQNSPAPETGSSCLDLQFRGARAGAQTVCCPQQTVGEGRHESFRSTSACRTTEEANYLLSIINSDALKVAVTPLMSKGQFGPRDLHKHPWKLNIPWSDPTRELHTTKAEAGTVIRREWRVWLRTSAEGRAVESAVGRLLADNQK